LFIKTRHSRFLPFCGWISSISFSEKIIKHLKQNESIGLKLFVLLLQLDVHLVEGAHPLINHKSGHYKVLEWVFDGLVSLPGDDFLLVFLLLVYAAKLLKLGL
jgi:hypothetical protein